MATKRVILNRAAIANIQLAVGDGLFKLATDIVEGARPPDEPIIGQGLVERGGAIAWVGTKKIAGSQIEGREIPKPRGVRTSALTITAVGGFGFPARFNEIGTVHQPARPFLTPSLLARVGGAFAQIQAACKRRRAVGR